MSKTTEEIISIIKARQKEKGLKLYELRELMTEVTVEQTMMSLYMNNHNQIPLDAYCEICRVLELNPFPIRNEVLKLGK